jgi:hypothetical protein
MIGDHYGPTAGRATVLVRAVDAILGTHSSEQQRAWMGMAVRAVQTLAPTHPHVTAAGSTIAQYVLGPIASLLDHGRDAAKRSWQADRGCQAPRSRTVRQRDGAASRGRRHTRHRW